MGDDTTIKLTDSNDNKSTLSPHFHLTDGIISIPENPPAILELDPYPLLFHAKNSAKDLVEDTPENRRRGWQRICLFAL